MAHTSCRPPALVSQQQVGHAVTLHGWELQAAGRLLELLQSARGGKWAGSGESVQALEAAMHYTGRQRASTSQHRGTPPAHLQHALESGATEQAQPSVGGLHGCRHAGPLQARSRQGSQAGRPRSQQALGAARTDRPAPSTSPDRTHVAAGGRRPLLLRGPAVLHGVDERRALQDALHPPRNGQHVLDGCRHRRQASGGQARSARWQQ